MGVIKVSRRQLHQIFRAGPVNSSCLCFGESLTSLRGDFGRGGCVVYLQVLSAGKPECSGTKNTSVRGVGEGMGGWAD